MKTTSTCRFVSCAQHALCSFFFFSSHPRRSGNGNFLLQFITLACRVARESIRTHSPHFVSTTITRDFARCGSHNRCHVLVTFETNLKVCADVWRLICAFSLKQIFLFHPFRQIFFQFVVCVRYLSIWGEIHINFAFEFFSTHLWWFVYMYLALGKECEASLFTYVVLSFWINNRNE